MKSDPVIVAENLTRRFGQLLAVDHLSLEIRAGEIFGFLGHNGAGKTTTVRLLNGILTPNEGTSRVLGLSPLTDGQSIRARTGVLTETSALEERLTARDNLTIYADLFSVPRAEVASRIQATLELFDLADRANDKVAGFSKGMKQRLALARVLLHKPDVIFLDEPSSGLDPVAAHQLHEIIKQLSHQQHHTIFLCTHNLTEAQALCDRVGIMEHGRLVALGAPADLAHQMGHNLRVEVEVMPGSALQALKVLQSFSGVKAVSGNGSCLSLDMTSREAIPDMLSTLVSADIRVYRVTPQDLSLEDVYFALHNRNNGNGANGAAL